MVRSLRARIQANRRCSIHVWVKFQSCVRKETLSEKGALLYFVTSCPHPAVGATVLSMQAHGGHSTLAWTDGHHLALDL